MKKLLLSLIALCGFTAANAAEITEELTIANFGFTQATSYKDVTYTSDVTGITYSGNMCQANETNGSGMQFRTSSKKEAGLVSTANPQGLKIKSVTVEPSTAASTTNQWDVYGSEKAYSTFMDLYATATAGTAIGNGTIKATLTANAPLEFFGFRGNKNAIYIQKITIVYETADAATKEAAGLKFSQDQFTVELGSEFVAPTLTKVTTAAVTYASSDDSVVSVDEETGDVHILAAGNATITATTPETDQFYAGRASYDINVVKLTVVRPAKVMAAGDYVLVAGGKYNTLFDKGYGYMTTVDFPEDGKVNMTDLLKFETVEGGYTITTSTGKILGTKVGYKTFDTTNDSADNRVWTVAIDEAGNATITNVSTGKVIYQDPQFGSFGAYTATEKGDNFVLPVLYKDGVPTGIDGVEADDANAPVEFFNLQGVRVANPENGLFIRRQGNKVEKVVIR